ncbi:type IV toxin-antitoxin system AbiEi family antitoxin domain-containing protein [Geodermatophilus sp. SYSU D01036]
MTDWLRTGPVLRRSEALAAGLSDGELAAAVRRGELTRIRRGAYVDPTAGAPHHRALVVATAPALRDGSVISHASAAVLHGLPLWRVAPERVHVTRRPPPPGAAVPGSTCTWRGSPTTS